MDIGNRITQLRKTRNMSTNKLANTAGISQSYLREIELGQKNPTVEILSYICDALKITLADFFTTNRNEIDPFLLSALKSLNKQEQLKLAELIAEIKKNE